MCEMVNIRTFINRIDAELLKSMLESHGIKASISADDCAGLRSHLVFGTGGVKLFVGKDDVEEAEKILEK